MACANKTETKKQKILECISLHAQNKDKYCFVKFLFHSHTVKCNKILNDSLDLTLSMLIW